MNVMQRPLFRASGGEAFPDLSGDGKITQRDILMGRGVIPRGMEEGGLAALMPASDAAMMQEGMVDPAMMQGGPLNPAEAELAGDILGAREEGEQLGLDYLAQTMDGIDSASNTEELINSIRGKAQPLEARVQELATFVGEEDAMRTPESVLTMVQPVIMMTEEGAIDTGIGELMQGVMGDTEMSADMGQGVGALMAQGQPAPEMTPQMAAPPPMPAAMPPMAPPPQMAQAPMAPPQQFAAGGPVVHMAEAGDPAKKQLALQAYFDEYLPVYENLIGSSNEDREKDRALALAKAGFQFASGRDAKGQNIAGSGFLANLASAGAGFTDDIGAIDREQRKLAQGTKTLALQSAFSTDQAKRAAEASLAEKRYDRQTKIDVAEINAASKNQPKYGTFTYTNNDGQPTDGLFVIEGVNAGAMYINGQLVQAPPGILNQIMPKINAMNIQTPTGGAPTGGAPTGGAPTGEIPVSDSSVTVGMDVGDPDVGVATLQLLNPTLLKNLAEGTLSVGEDLRMVETINNTINARLEGGDVKTDKQIQLPIAMAILNRAELSKKTDKPPVFNKYLIAAAQKAVADTGADFKNLQEIYAVDQAKIDSVFGADDFNPKAVYGAADIIKQGMTGIGEFVQENAPGEPTTPLEGSKVLATRAAITDLARVAQLKLALDDRGRLLAAEFKSAGEAVKDLLPSLGGTNASALRSATQVRRRLEQKQQNMQTFLDNSGTAAASEPLIANAQQEILNITYVINSLKKLEGGLSLAIDTRSKSFDTDNPKPVNPGIKNIIDSFKNSNIINTLKNPPV